MKAVYVTHLQESIFRLKPEGLKNMLASNRRGFFGEPDSSPGLWARQHSIELVHHQIFRENFGKLFGGHGFERMRGVALGTKHEHRVHHIDADQCSKKSKPAVGGEPLLLEGEIRLAQLVVLVDLVEATVAASSALRDRRTREPSALVTSIPGLLTEKVPNSEKLAETIPMMMKMSMGMKENGGDRRRNRADGD